MSMLFYGIDPGLSGGIAILDAAGAIVQAVQMPATEGDVLYVLRHELHDGSIKTSTPDEGLIVRAWVECPARAVLERVSASPQMGIVSACTFCRGYGALRMALAAVEIPFDEVSPIRWQNAMGCRSGGDKNVTKRRAMQLFPKWTITHAIADALLLAEYCRRSELGLWGEAPKKKRAKVSRRPAPLLEVDA